MTRSENDFLNLHTFDPLGGGGLYRSLGNFQFSFLLKYSEDYTICKVVEYLGLNIGIFPSIG